MKDWLAFLLFDRRGPWQRWACARVESWFRIEEPPYTRADASGSGPWPFA